MGYIYDIKEWCMDYLFYVGMVEYGVKRILDYVVEYIGVGVVRWSVFCVFCLEMFKSIFFGMYWDFFVYDENDWYCFLMGKLIINVCINLLIVLLCV